MPGILVNRGSVVPLSSSAAVPAPNLDDFGGTAMRKIILMMSVSLDGFIEGPNRELDGPLITTA